MGFELAYENARQEARHANYWRPGVPVRTGVTAEADGDRMGLVS
jgi:hypothetical protein